MDSFNASILFETPPEIQAPLLLDISADELAQIPILSEEDTDENVISDEGFEHDDHAEFDENTKLDQADSQDHD